MNTEELAKELEKHEAICAERWKTVFNQLQAIDQRYAKPFEQVDSPIKQKEQKLKEPPGQ